MNNSSRRIAVATALLFGLLSPVRPGFAAPTPSPPAAGERALAAKVNGAPIYRETFQAEVEKTLARTKKHGRTLSAEEERTLTDSILDQLIQKELLAQALAKVKVPDLEARVAELYTEEQKAFGGAEQFERNLSSRGSDPQAYRKTLGDKLREQLYMEQVGLVPVQVPEETIKTFYQKNQSSWRHPEVVKVRQIGLAPEDANAKGAAEKARAAAAAVQKKLAAGQELLPLVDELTAQGWKTSGGDLGFIQRGNLPPALEEVAFTLAPGSTSEVLQGPDGLHVLQVLEKREPGVYSLEEVRPIIVRYLEKDVLRQNIAKHAETLREKAKIELIPAKP